MSAIGEAGTSKKLKNTQEAAAENNQVATALQAKIEADLISLAGNVGVVSEIFAPQNDRHADMSALCRRHDTDHVGNIAPCRLVGRCVSVVSA